MQTLSKEIKLSMGMVALVDNEDFDYLNKFRWCAHKRGRAFYAESTINGVRVIMHNVIMNPPKGMLIDHIFHNGLDNRKSQLRLATKSQNNANRTSRKNSSSKYLGVAFEKDRNKWTARIRKNGQGYRLGSFLKETDAALAYNKKAFELHGEFANLNIII